MCPPFVLPALHRRTHRRSGFPWAQPAAARCCFSHISHTHLGLDGAAWRSRRIRNRPPLHPSEATVISRCLSLQHQGCWAWLHHRLPPPAAACGDPRRTCTQAHPLRSARLKPRPCHEWQGCGLAHLSASAQPARGRSPAARPCFNDARGEGMGAAPTLLLWGSAHQTLGPMQTDPSGHTRPLNNDRTCQTGRHNRAPHAANTTTNNHPHVCWGERAGGQGVSAGGVRRPA
jgi:hypothetical protein